MLTILDISNLESPKLMSQFTPYEGFDEHNFYYAPYRIRVVGNTAFIITKFRGIEIIDLSSIKSPKSLSVANPGVDVHKNEFGDNRDFVIQDDQLFILNQWGLGQKMLTIYDISDPTNPSVMADHDLGIYGNTLELLEIKDSIAYIGAGGLYLYDISDIYNPRLLGEQDFSIGNINNIYVQNNIVFVSGPTPTNTVFLDISDPSNIDFLGSYRYPPYKKIAYDAVVNSSESLMYLARGGLRVVDIKGFRESWVAATEEKKKEIIVFDEFSMNAKTIILNGKILFVGASDGFYILEQNHK